jgi:hypothetical protein
MIVLQYFLFNLQTKIILSFSPGHLLFSKNRFSLASVLTFKAQYTRATLHFTVNKGAYGLANVRVNHVVTDSASVCLITNALSVSLRNDAVTEPKYQFQVTKQLM